MQYKYGTFNQQDNPLFPQMADYFEIISGSSLLASELLMNNKHDIVINWMGGFHHARKNSAHGFCYINDIALSIYKLLE